MRKGQVLIAGEERDGAETVRPVSARGTVMARVWDGATVRVSLREKQTEYTGKKLQFHGAPKRGARWFDRMKRVHTADIVAEANRAYRGGRVL